MLTLTLRVFQSYVFQGLLQWNLPVDIDSWMTSIGCQTSASGNGKYLMEIHDLQNIVAKLRVAMPDATELACAKAIAFFKPGLSCYCIMYLNCTGELLNPVG